RIAGGGSAIDKLPFDDHRWQHSIELKPARVNGAQPIHRREPEPAVAGAHSGGLSYRALCRGQAVSSAVRSAFDTRFLAAYDRLQLCARHTEHAAIRAAPK